ncbi:hypothetical protein OKA05_08920 [Luteolibacter arcticus]|uniref:Uncharacterized protein n=1 Tax=Luteolibacter arcticus TaxID=1581411 RepID=A0ABT3GGD5_9BACT|nr:hypothetical protein [Luteolibacter arcticus]MCW1922675.1 hypothetical protein [Luteolibacter arcticus]
MKRPTKNGGISSPTARSSKAAAKKGAPDEEGAKTKKETKTAANRKAAATKAAEMAGKKRAGNSFVASYPEVSPLELAQLVVAMGLSSDPKGGQKALTLLVRCDNTIKYFQGERERLVDIYAKSYAERIEGILAMDLDLESPQQFFTVNQVWARLKLDPLVVGKEEIRGEALWTEFCRQVGQRPGFQMEAIDGSASEIYTLEELLSMRRKYLEWRASTAKANQKLGKNNLPRRGRGPEEEIGGDEDYSASGDSQSGSPFTRLPKV